MGTLQNAPEIKGGTLDEMPDSRESELIESTSSMKTGIRRGREASHSHISDP